MRLWLAWAGVLFPLLGLACEGDNRHTCQKQLATLVSYRTEAIKGAFGDLLGVLPQQIKIKFVSSKDDEYKRFFGQVAYDQRRTTLILPRTLLAAKTPNPLRWAVYYWPFYEDAEYRESFPVIETIDNALWGVYLQEAARQQNLTWPHEDCTSVDIGKRLPCEMLAEGVAEHLKEVRTPIFNSNRLDRIWPESFSEFSKGLWRHDAAYLDVQRYGGILLVKPLIDQFGVPRALAYFAQTPFEFESNSVRESARRYQERAQAALSVSTADRKLVASEALAPAAEGASE